MTNQAKQIETIRAYALDHYDHGGWDVVVEAYSDSDIREALDQHATITGALIAIAIDVGAHYERRAEIKSL